MARKSYHHIDQLLAGAKLKKVEKCNVLTNWQQANYTLNEHQIHTLKVKHQAIKQEGSYWNEEELKIRFLAFIIDIAEIDVPDKMKVFYERSLQGKVNQLTLSVRCDCMVATPLGINSPQESYFFCKLSLQRAKSRASGNLKREREMFMILKRKC